MPFPPRLRRRAAPELRAAALHRLRVLLGTGEPDEGGLGEDERGGGERDEPRDEAADEAEIGPAPGSRRARFGLDGRAALVLAVLASAAVVLGGLLLWRARPSSVDVGPAAAYVARGAATAGVEGGPSVDPASAPDLFVDVQGRVRTPGVVRLPAGSRVLDALRAAGGPRGGTPTFSLNLARPLVDGEQVVLAPAGGAAVAGGGAGVVGGPVDLNAATLADLDGLPGVGPVLAQRILEFRGEHGRFNGVEELREVPGIGPSKYAALRAKVRV